MKAIVLTKYGNADVLALQTIPKPTPSKDQVLVRVKAFSVTAADCRIRAARFPKGFALFARLAFGLFKPRISVLGNTFSGIIEEIGANVQGFKVGDEVCGTTGFKMGTYAEYVAVNSRKSIVLKPASVNHEQAAGMLFGGTAALYFLRNKLHLHKGETILVNGASGAVGTNAVQLARYFGAKITTTAQQKNEKLVKKLGSVRNIDYTKQPLGSIDEKFDVVLDTVGNISPKQAKKLLNNSSGRAGLMVATLSETLRAKGPVKTGTASEKAEDIAFLLSLMQDKKLEAVIDSIFNFEDIVKAHQRADSGEKVGNIVVTL